MAKTKQHTPEANQLGYQIVSYEVGAYSCIEYDGVPSNVEFEVGVEYLIHESLERLLVKVTIGMFTTIANEKREAVHFVGNVFFNVIGLKEYVKDQVEFSLPDSFVASIANIAVSTSRGVLLMKNSATKFAGQIMPTISTQSLIPKTKWTLKNLPNLGLKTE